MSVFVLSCGRLFVFTHPELPCTLVHIQPHPDIKPASSQPIQKSPEPASFAEFSDNAKFSFRLGAKRFGVRSVSRYNRKRNLRDVLTQNEMLRLARNVARHSFQKV